MVGVVHANTPLDAIQRFIGKIELGIIPSVLDTVVFVKDGEITKVYELEFKVKVPSGMVEQDLARPVIDICDFESGELEYEIYTFGEENVIMPVSKKNQKHGIELLAEKKIIDTIRRFDPNPSVEFLSESSIRVFVSKESIPSIIGRNGSTIKELENELSLHIDVEEASNNHEVNNYALPFDFSESRTALLLDVGREYSGAMGEIFVNNEFLISSKINRKGNIKILKRSSDGKLFSKVVNSKNDIEIFLKTR